MTSQNQADATPSRQRRADPLPATPSDEAERPEGLAFDTEPGADLAGVPTGDQIPRHPGADHTQETVTESGDSIGLAIPQNQDAGEDE